jgi:hypothetical protein
VDISPSKPSTDDAVTLPLSSEDHNVRQNQACAGQTKELGRPCRAAPVRPRISLSDVGFLLFLAATILVVTFVYVSHERVFYLSDYSAYQDMTIEIVDKFRLSPAEAIRSIAVSTTREYNSIFTLPLIPFVLIFGESRLVYECALAIVYLLPFVLVLGWLATQLVPKQPRLTFRIAVIVALLTPVVWIPTLRGYPDAGAAVLVELAILAYLYDPRLRRRWQYLALGFLLAAAMIFRRHFGYACVALLGAMGLVVLVRFVLSVRLRGHGAWRALLIDGLKVGLIALVTLVVLATLDRPFIGRFLTTNYNALYADYMESPGRVLAYYAESYGWIAMIGAVLGLALGIRGGVLTSDGGALLSTYAALCFALWLVVVRQLSDQYTLQFTPAIVVGLTALGRTAWLRMSGRPRGLLLGAGGAYLVINALVGLTYADFGNPAVERAVFAIKAAPDVRGDWDEMARLVRYLRELAPHGEPVYVAASSLVLGESLAASAERTLYGRADARLNFLPVPAIDSRDSFPLEPLLQARYVVLAQPPQFHMGADRQRVVGVVSDIFADQREFALDFILLPNRFTLDGGTVVSVYQRTRPTAPEVALVTLSFMQRYVGRRPGGQPDWLVLERAGFTSVSRQGVAADAVLGPPFIPERPSSRLLYLGGLPDRGRLTGTLSFSEAACEGATLRLSLADPAGHIVEGDSISLEADGSRRFELPFAEGDASMLLLNIEAWMMPNAASACAFELSGLNVSADQGP